jgi:hypothetical protein
MDPLTILASLNPLDWILQPINDLKQTIDLIILGFKIVVLLFIVQFVRSRFGSGPIVTILILVLGYIVLFQLWAVFAPGMFIYLLIFFGFTGIIFDLVISKPWAKGGGEEEEGGEHMSGKQYSEELAKRGNIRKGMMGR